FDFSFTSPRDLAHRTVARALSDLAACGAEPKLCLLGLGLPEDVEIGRVKKFISELVRQLKRYGAKLAGGDLTEAGRWFIGITSIGIQKRGKAIKRCGSSPNELLCTTGRLGLAAAGLTLLKEYPDLAGRFPSLAKAYLRPKPKVAQGVALAEHGIATAAIDISDGLFLDAWRLAEASGLSIVIEEARLPVARKLKEFCRITGRRVEEFVSAGDDYELLFTAPASRLKRLSELGWRAYRIGYTKRGAGVYIEDASGRLKRAPKTGYIHFEKATRS
ncbi:MAG TPA: thiamine-phosphate kinase, partial [Proteobacteria bacterium]|nr:thiamine-phosphate kinase [Pseudomonadota bacterium]